MNIFKAYYTGLKRTVKLPRPVLLIYSVNLLLAVLVVFPMLGVMKKELGNTVIGMNLIKNFSASDFSDFYAQALPAIKYLFSQIKWVVLIYWILNVFLAGGIIRTLNQDKFTMTSFFSGAGTNFFRFFGINVIMLLFHILVILIVYVPMFIIIYSISDTVSSEITIYRIIGISVFIHFILMYILLMIADYSKFYAVLYNSKNIFKSVSKGFKYVFGNFWRATGLYFLLIILPVGIMIGYFLLDVKIDTHVGVGILIAFLVQQAFIFLRVWFRIWIYSSPLQMYTADFLKDENVQAQLSVMNTWNKKAKEQQMIENYNDFVEQDNVITEAEVIKKIKKEEIEELKKKSNESEGKNMLDILKEEEDAKDELDEDISETEISGEQESETKIDNTEIVSEEANDNIPLEIVEVGDDSENEIPLEIVEKNIENSDDKVTPNKKQEEIKDVVDEKINDEKINKDSLPAEDEDGDIIPIEEIDEDELHNDFEEDEGEDGYRFIHRNEDLIDFSDEDDFEEELPDSKNNKK